MNKKSLTEADIRTKFITPVLTGPDGEKWNLMAQICEEVQFTVDRVIFGAKTVQRNEVKKPDGLLFRGPNLPLAGVETKDNNHSVGDLIAAQSDRLAVLQNHKQGLLQQLFPSPADTSA